MYDYNKIKTLELKQNFLDLGDEWWWGTNRMIPINIIFKSAFEHYKSSLVTFSGKDFEVMHGPIISLSNIIQKRIKRRNIQLVRKLT